MFLSTTSQKLQVILSGAVTTTELPWTVDYGEVASDNSTSAPKSANGTTNGGTAVDMVAAPGSSLVREILHLSVQNADTASATVTIRVNDGGTPRKIVVFTLLTGESLGYDIASGWKAFDTKGNVKTTSVPSSTIPVSGGGTGDISFTPYAVITGGTTGTGALQDIGSIGTLGLVLTSNGPAALPSMKVQGANPINVWLDGTTITFDVSESSKNYVQLGGNRTLALTGNTAGQSFMIILQQDASGSRTVTWWSGILWSNGSVPVLSTGANKFDVFTFVDLGGGTYLGFSALNF